MVRDMKQADLMKTFSAEGAKVTPKAWDGVVDGQVVTTYGVTVSLTASGSTEVRTVRESDEVDPTALVASMRTALAARTKATRAAIRRERAPS